MKKILITGASGFVGTHLVEHLLSQGGYQIYGTVYGSENNYLTKLLPDSQLYPLNLLSQSEVEQAVATIRPDEVVHLAALSSPARSHQNPLETFQNNIGAQIYLFEALLKLDRLPTVLVIGSAEEYGKVSAEITSIDENTPLNPTSPYAVSKIAQDFLGLQYFHQYSLPVIRLRPFNHTGPRHTPVFVVPAFAKQVAEIEAGINDSLTVEGDLEVERDFTDVKDMVAAYSLALTKCTPGEVYNVGSGKTVRVADLLELVLSKSSCPVKVVKDPNRQGKSAVKSLRCNYQKFHQATGWQPSIALEETVGNVLEYWRQAIKGD